MKTYTATLLCYLPSTSLCLQFMSVSCNSEEVCHREYFLRHTSRCSGEFCWRIWMKNINTWRHLKGTIVLYPINFIKICSVVHDEELKMYEITTLPSFLQRKKFIWIHKIRFKHNTYLKAFKKVKCDKCTGNECLKSLFHWVNEWS